MADMSGELLLTYEPLLKDLYTLSRSEESTRAIPHYVSLFNKRPTFTGEHQVFDQVHDASIGILDNPYDAAM